MSRIPSVSTGLTGLTGLTGPETEPAPGVSPVSQMKLDVDLLEYAFDGELEAAEMISSGDHGGLNFCAPIYLIYSPIISPFGWQNLWE